MNSINNIKSAKNIGYNNTASGLTATDVQGAIDELSEYSINSFILTGFMTPFVFQKNRQNCILYL